MQNIIYVFNTVLKFASVKLSFPPFSFTILQFFICLAVASIIVYFIRSIFF